MVLAEGHKHTMALDQSALLEVLDALKAADVDDKIRLAAETIYQALIEAELSAVIGAVPYQRTDARTAQPNGHRLPTLTTTAGDLELKTPKLRAGSLLITNGDADVRISMRRRKSLTSARWVRVQWVNNGVLHAVRDSLAARSDAPVRGVRAGAAERHRVV
jgi:hypothetical protein